MGKGGGRVGGKFLIEAESAKSGKTKLKTKGDGSPSQKPSKEKVNQKNIKKRGMPAKMGQIEGGNLIRGPSPERTKNRN